MRTDFKFLLIFLSLTQGIQGWDYKQQGADWKDAFIEETCKSGKSQSPIDLKNPTLDNNLKGNPMVFNNYDKDILQCTLENNGHTIKMTPVLLNGTNLPPFPTISGGGLKGTYEFAQLHFHWGDSENKGSEHKIEGKAFPMEVHLVHFNKKYTTLTKAAAEKDGLAVLGFFYEIDKDGKDYEMFKKLNTPLKTVIPKRNTKTIQSFNLKKFLPDNPEKKDFYRYTGSLTTPGCNEVVTWTVFKDPLKLPQELMDEFRKQKIGEQGTNLVNNFRNVQPLNGRKILANFESNQESNLESNQESNPESNPESTGGSSSPNVFWAMLGINAIALTFLIGW